MTRKLLAADDVKEAMVALLRTQFNLKQTAEWERRIAEALGAITAAEPSKQRIEVPPHLRLSDEQKAALKEMLKNMPTY